MFFQNVKAECSFVDWNLIVTELREWEKIKQGLKLVACNSFLFIGSLYECHSLLKNIKYRVVIFLTDKSNTCIVPNVKNAKNINNNLSKYRNIVINKVTSSMNKQDIAEYIRFKKTNL